MNDDTNGNFACTGNWLEIEARFQRAKQALLDIQQQHCAAADELLLARAQMRQLLDAVFPGAEDLACRPQSDAPKYTVTAIGQPRCYPERRR